MFRAALALVAAAACGLTTACYGPSGGRLGSAGGVQVFEGNELPAPQRSDVVGVSRPYLIGPFDKLEIDVFGIEGMTRREVSADAAGRISFPIAGVIDASGMTPRELEVELVRRLRAGHIRNPEVTVNLKETVGQMVTVDGQVKQPGVYPVIGRMTLTRAIATARGLDEFAKIDDVVVMRNVGGQRLAALYNLAAIRRANYPDPDIYPNDVVIVGDSKTRRLIKDATQLAPLITTPLIIALQNNGN
ncbi:polysaccharide biosynthesis/export family protein [Novosphingobium sp. Gsoil 351]|uniref:polysaccharide biosynthesis/export family protein n=1 Tax=Novosphingobium sp. Gsoil 351 TaxID=2675225 RepID=UPI0012B4767E|nr:polysaccharide biosynthesis/export family protein [Novosphingobium sp. Gsoil 351]QGN54940.1 polysaccharide export protein [Novosphingobium sp. Gsoil 351]